MHSIQLTLLCLNGTGKSPSTADVLGCIMRESCVDASSGAAFPSFFNCHITSFSAFAPQTRLLHSAMGIWQARWNTVVRLTLLCTGALVKAGTGTGVAHLKGQQAVVSIQVLPAPSETPDVAARLHTFHLYLTCEDSRILLAALPCLDWRLKQLSVPAVWFLHEGYPLSTQWHLAGHSLHARALSSGQ